MEVTGISRSAFYRYFEDLYALMETLLLSLEEDIFDVAAPWFSQEGSPVETLRESLSGLVRVCYEQGPILRAVSDASTIDERLENVWSAFLNQFDDAVTANIEAQQHEGVIQPFSARPAAVALNRMDAYMLVNAFGRHPRHNPELVLEAISRIWISTLYQSPPVTNEEQ
jgi:AcrR family transcriptional regulator